VLTDEERAEALARYQARLDALPPRSDQWTARIADLFASIRLRMARDRARMMSQNETTPLSGVPDTSGGYIPRSSGVASSPGETNGSLLGRDGGVNSP
jgi:hypothetical protein